MKYTRRYTPIAAELRPTVRFKGDMKVKTKWEDENDEEEEALASLSICPMGTSCAGGLFAFLFGYMASILTNNHLVTIFILSLAGSFGIAAGLAPGSKISLMKRSDFAMMFVSIFVLSSIMRLFFAVDRLENIFLVSMSSANVAGSLRPIMLVPMALITGSPMKELLPTKNTC